MMIIIFFYYYHFIVSTFLSLLMYLLYTGYTPQPMLWQYCTTLWPCQQSFFWIWIWERERQRQRDRKRDRNREKGSECKKMERETAWASGLQGSEDTQHGSSGATSRGRLSLVTLPRDGHWEAGSCWKAERGISLRSSQDSRDGMAYRERERREREKKRKKEKDDGRNARNRNKEIDTEREREKERERESKRGSEKESKRQREWARERPTQTEGGLGLAKTIRVQLQFGQMEDLGLNCFQLTANDNVPV